MSGKKHSIKGLTIAGAILTTIGVLFIPLAFLTVSSFTSMNGSSSGAEAVAKVFLIIIEVIAIVCFTAGGFTCSLLGMIFNSICISRGKKDHQNIVFNIVVLIISILTMIGHIAALITIVISH